MAIVWDKPRYDQSYSLAAYKTPWGIPFDHPKLFVHYSMGLMQRAFEKQIAQFLALPGAAQITNIAIIGGGFGTTAEIFEANGVNAIHTEVSPHILAAQGTTEEGEFLDAMLEVGLPADGSYRQYGPDGTLSLNPVAFWKADQVRNNKTALEEDLMSQSSRNRVKNGLPGNLDGILTELVLDSLEDDEVLAFVENCERLRPNPSRPVIHTLQPNHTNPIFNSKSLVAWKALLTGAGFNHSVVDVETFEVL